MNISVEDNGNKMVGKGEMLQNAGAWENDLELTYSRIK